MAFDREKNQKLLFKADSIKKVITVVNGGGATGAAHNKAGETPPAPREKKRKSPRPQNRSVSKLGGKEERMLRYAFSAECAKLNSAETRKGQNHRLAPLYQYFTEI